MSEDGPDDDPLRIDGSAAFGLPVVVDTTRGEVRRIVERMRREPHAELTRISNLKYRAVLQATPSSVVGLERVGGEPWTRLCGDIVVFHCARWVMNGSPIPLIRA